MSQSLYTSMGGISAAQTELNVISNNIANLNTTGYKSSSIHFSDVYYRTLSPGSGASGISGGSNPIQVGIGVQVSAITKNFNSGIWVATGKTTDMMIQGNGFFTAQSPSGEIFYTRAGNFSLDSAGDLVTADGYKVIGTDKVLATSSAVTPVHIPQLILPKVTSNDNFFSKDITTLNSCTLTDGVFNVSINGAAATTITVDTSTYDTMGELAANIQTQIGAPAVSGVTVTCDATTGGTIKFAVAAPATSLAFTNASANQSNFLAQTGLATAVIDTTTHTYTSSVLDYKVDVSQVTSVSDATKVNSYSIAGDGSIQVTYQNGDSLSVKVGADDNTYEFVYTTAENIVITGENVNVDANVAVPANFVIQLASITNTDGLLARGNNLFSAGINSGDIVYSVGNAMGLGDISSGGLEASNVDLSSEFSNMILAQRAVQANSRVFTTTSDVMETIVGMGR